MITATDLARRDAIADYDVLGGEPERDLEGLVRLAASICGVGTAVINIIDDRFQHQIAAIGFEPSVCSREESMCAVVFAAGELVAVPDARVDGRFAQNPFVTGEIANVRFYASSPLRMPDGIVIGTLCVFDDDTGELAPGQAEALGLLAHQVVDVLELRRTSRELSRSNEQLARFAGQVSHDLRNPLAALSGFLELAADSPELSDAPDVARSLGRARSAADRMTDLVTDLLAYARIGGARPNRAGIEVEALAAAVLEDLQAEIRRSGAELVVDAPARLTGDTTLLRALLQNLVSNALKYGGSGDIPPRVEVRAEAVPGGWRITVDDNGSGVPEAERERVFGLLERGTGRDGASAADGLGIGLSTCRRIVQAHGGRIGIEDSPLGGARVWVLLPE